MLSDTLNIRYLKQEPSEVVATLMVTEAVCQPFGLLHGGVAAALVEEVASCAGLLNCPPGHRVVGVELNINHLKAVRSGSVTATATPLHVGGRTQVWEVNLRNDNGHLTGTGRCTLLVIEA